MPYEFTSMGSVAIEVSMWLAIIGEGLYCMTINDKLCYIPVEIITQRKWSGKSHNYHSICFKILNLIGHPIHISSEK